jgi:hypothetical protein
MVGPFLLPRGFVCFRSDGDSEMSFSSFSDGVMVECAVQFWCLLKVFCTPLLSVSIMEHVVILSLLYVLLCVMDCVCF